MGKGARLIIVLNKGVASPHDERRGMRHATGWYTGRPLRRLSLCTTIQWECVFRRHLFVRPLHLLRHPSMLEAFTVGPNVVQLRLRNSVLSFTAVKR